MELIKKQRKEKRKKGGERGEKENRGTEKKRISRGKSSPPAAPEQQSHGRKPFKMRVQKATLGPPDVIEWSWVFVS